MSEQKKQPSGLGGVRPGGYEKDKFKELAKKNGVSQTEMFERLLWSYMGLERKEEQKKAIDYTDEVELIARNIENVFEGVKRITDKAQNTVLSMQSNADQTKKNLTLDVETLEKKVRELQKRNEELEGSNAVFSDVKAGLEDDIEEIKEKFKSKEVELNECKEILKEKESDMKGLEKFKVQLEKDCAEMQKKLDKLTEKINIKDNKISGLETVNSNLKSTVENMEDIKRAEISAIKERYEAVVSGLEGKLNDFEMEKAKEFKRLEKAMVQFEKESKAVKVQLNEMTGKLSEKDSRIASLKVVNDGLKSTIENMESVKKAEISVIEERYKSVVSDLNNRIESQGDNMRVKLEAEKKMALSEVKMELASLKVEYAKLKEDHIAEIAKLEVKR